MLAFKSCAAVLLIAVSAGAAETITLKPKLEKESTPVISLHEVSERPLRALLEYLSTLSGITIRVADPKLERLLISVEVLRPNTTWREVLNAVSRQHKLRIDESRLKEK